MRGSGKRSMTMAVVFCLAAAPAFSLAKPGDAASVVRARKAYAKPMKGDDTGLQNARRAELKYQLSLARKHRHYAVKHKRHVAQASGQAKVAGVEESHSGQGATQKD